jgi:hypothetical protein
MLTPFIPLLRKTFLCLPAIVNEFHAALWTGGWVTGWPCERPPKSTETCTVIILSIHTSSNPLVSGQFNEAP